MSKVTPGTSDPVYPPPPNPAFAQPTQPPPPGYQPPPPGYQPPPYGAPAQSSSTVVVAQPGVFGGAQPGGICRYQETPCLVVCQFCNATVTTSTCYSVGTFTWVAAGVILFLGFWLGCCLIPFCINDCKDVIHTCPNCKQSVGRYNRM